ncbi:MAG TPA: hypothetical protein VN634_15990 [Candidatus Limnocylindrales bacterium]|nr:hypothetical protein [Candidatus Limnocylindrales bacterium]
MPLLATFVCAFFAALVATDAMAADVPATGRQLSIRDGSKQALSLDGKDASLSAPSAASDEDPTITGASLLIRNPQSGEAATFILPAVGWSFDGKAYRFRNPDAPDGSSPVKTARIADGSIKVRARASGITLDEESQGSIAISFASGTLRVCLHFGGTIVRDEAGRFQARAAAAPASCDDAGTTTTTLPETTTTTQPDGTTTTTTTTLPVPALCGDLAINGSEQCDPPGSDCGGSVCNADCTCPCDPLDPSVCMHPFPNDYFTVPDAASPTGRRVHFSVTGMPRNQSARPVEPSDYNYSDGFSPGALITLRIPGIDLVQTGAVPITDIARSLDADAPIVIVNAATLEHHKFWAELDSLAEVEADRSLLLRPAVNFEEGARYIVALRNLKDSAGAPIAPSADFLAYRDDTPLGNAAKEARRSHMESLFTTLAAAGVARGDLNLAWDFTVASAGSTTGRLVYMRDDAFSRLGAAAPTFVVTSVTDDVDSNIYRTVEGVFLVDRYVDSPLPGARFLIGPDGLPVRQPTPQQANFICNIPRAALSDALATAVPARASLYGHGLFGEASEVGAGNVEAMGNEHNFVFCATDWIGMALTDVPTALAATVDLSNFPTLPDRLQQAALNFLVLGRLMIHPDGFVSNAAFQDALGNPVIDTSNIYYDGNSQGGIAGGMVMAVAQDIRRGVLGVPGMNYSTLLQRSVDFDTYATGLYASYQNQLERPLLFSLIQMLWDRGEPNGYAHHMTADPLPGTPTHDILMHVAFGDHQVANIAAEVEARTIGAHVYQPALAPGRHSDVEPYFGIPAIPAFPFDGSALVVWDSGVPTPPTTNSPPREGSDPHSKPRSTPAARLQKSEFLKENGAVVDVCNASPCLAP